MVRIYLVSDLHLEYHWYKPPVPTEVGKSILVIAGDLGNPMLPSYKSYLIIAAELYKHVILIAGNHDYYSRKRTMEENRILIRELCKSVSDNIYFLHCESVILENIRFLGCTLWTDLSTVLCEKPCTKDFRMIKDLNIAKYQELHLQQRAWIRDNLASKSQDYSKTVVITHHPPSFNCVHNKYIYLDRANCYYYSDMNELVPQSDLWLSGHTHDSTLTYINNTPIVINPVGYPGEMNDFNPFLYIEVTDTSIDIHNFRCQINR